MLCISGCANPVKTFISNKIIKEINTNFAKADKWTCNIDASNSDLVKGKAKGVQIKGKNVVYNNLIFKEMDINMSGIEFDIKKGRLKKCNSVHSNILVSDTEITKMIKENINFVENPQIKAKNGLIELSGTISPINIPLNVELTGILSIEKGYNFILDPTRLEVSALGMNFPSWSKSVIKNKINPVYSIKDNKYGLSFNSIVAKNKYFEIDADFIPEKLFSSFME